MSIDSKNGIVRIEVTPVQITPGKMRRTTIQVEGLRNLIYSNQAPWGGSSSILFATHSESRTEGYERLVIEMQSGDVIEVEGRKIAFISEIASRLNEPTN